MIRLFLLALLTLAACGPVYRNTDAPMQTVQRLDLERYAGRWYEVASFPVSFQRDCTATTADYTLRPDRKVGVLNTCRRGAPDGPVAQIAGTAEVVAPGQLKVRLGRIPFAGDYWVLWVADDYRTAVLGTPGGRAGWILNREPEIPAERLIVARDVLAANGYDVTLIERTRH